MQSATELDPKALILNSFQIDGIDAAQCRSIFLDWALSLPEGQDSRAALLVLLDQYQDRYPGHPMTEVLLEGSATLTKPKRRGGWRSRSRA